MAKQNLFNAVKMTRPKHNRFDLTHDVKLSCNMGELIPILCMEAVPGDKFNLSAEMLVRFAPLVSPVMHRFDVTCHYFFVPNRILWANFEKWQVQEEVAGSVPAHPYMTITAAEYTSLCDYLHLPTPHSSQIETVSALPFAAYQCIYNEYYRDQNLITEINYKLNNGDNTSSAFLRTLRNRAWEHDYFTSALPFAQKGDPVEIPIGSQEVILDPDAEGTPQKVRLAADHGTNAPGGPLQVEAAVGDLQSDQVVDVDVVLDPNGTLITQDGGEATTINDLRRAFRLQEWLEKNARGGTRYIEHVNVHFGVKSSDKRLQRPEYITGVKSPVAISEVLNTTGADGAPAQGNMAGHGVSVAAGKYGYYGVEEHGYIMGIMSVMPKTAYMQGIPKHFLKYSDSYQTYYPSFAHIGEQEILNKEVYAYQGITGDDPFGYTPRYAEYKYHPSRVAGDFKMSLDFWHAARIFGSAPALNSTFVTSDPTTRIFAVEDETDKIYVNCLNKIMARRPMPKFGTPSF